MSLFHVAFGMIMLCSSAMNNLFVTFYLNLFVHHSQLQSNHFYFGQTMYLLWNALNDPIFGYLQDRATSSNSKSNPNQRLKTRLRIIRFGGLCWCFAFALVWFPPDINAETGNGPLWLAAHFALTICLYDAFLTLVELSHTALLSELTTSSQERATFNSYAAILAGLGSFSSFFGQYFYDATNITAFQEFMLSVSLACAAIFLISTFLLGRRGSTVNSIAIANNGASSSNSDSNNKRRSLGGFLFELKKHYNFWVFVVISSVQTFDCAFEKTSFVSMLDSAMMTSTAVDANSSNKQFRGLIVSLSFFLPWLVTFALTRQIQKRGVNSSITLILTSRLVVCSIMYIRPSWAMLLANRVLSELICRLTPLILADLVDEDRFLNQRDASDTKAASVIGSCHFFSKITSSLGPMLTFSLMTSSAIHPSWILIPFACVSLQLALWTRALFLYRDVEYFAKIKSFVERV